jgi:hypothetical protein
MDAGAWLPRAARVVASTCLPVPTRVTRHAPGMFMVGDAHLRNGAKSIQMRGQAFSCAPLSSTERTHWTCELWRRLRHSEMVIAHIAAAPLAATPKTPPVPRRVRRAPSAPCWRCGRRSSPGCDAVRGGVFFGGKAVEGGDGVGDAHGDVLARRRPPTIAAANARNAVLGRIGACPAGTTAAPPSQPSTRSPSRPSGGCMLTQAAHPHPWHQHKGAL